MIRTILLLLAFAWFALAGGMRARAQSLPVAPPGPMLPDAPDDATSGAQPAEAADPAPTRVDTASCAPLDLTPGALLSATTDEFSLASPIPWSEFEVEGQLIDTKQTVHALLDPTLQQYRTSLSLATMPELALVTARFGYQLLSHRTIDIANGSRLVLELAPLPLVRRVYVDINQSIWDKLLSDEVQRRMSIRVGSYLPWETIRRGCALLDEKRRVEEFLFDEGYFEATVEMLPATDVAETSLRVKIKLGDKYTLGKVTIGCPSGTERRGTRCVDTATEAPYRLALTEAEIREVFAPDERCLLFVCYGTAPFSRARFQEDIGELKQKFQTRGYPSVRVIASDPRLAINRNNNVVDVVVTIDQRRSIDVLFEGHDRDVVPDDQLRKQLTFDIAGSADDVEIGESAKALTTYLQTRGYFDAHVTWTRERIDTEPRPNTQDAGVHLDRIIFRVSMGPRRRVAQVQFLGNKAFSNETLETLIATKEARLGTTLFGTTVSANSAELITDQDRIKEAYRRIGYHDARVWPSASPVPAGLDNAAATAALLGTATGNELFVRFTIEEGVPTLVSRVVLTGDDGKPVDAGLCAELLGELATLLGNRDVAVRSDRNKCAATVRDLKFRSDDVSATRDGLRDYLFRSGRARSLVRYEPVPIGPHRVEARYTVDRASRLKLGKVVIRGNFRTANAFIYKELDLDEGQLLTSDRIADAARRLRNTGLFEAVNIEMPELECEQRTCSSEVITAVVRVEERYDHRLGIQLEVGYSQINELFGTTRLIQRNLFGRGISLTLSGTYGTRLQEAEAQLRFPQYWGRKLTRLPVTTLFSGLYREQDTERFGRLTTRGLGVDVSYVKQRPRTDEHPARVYSVGPSYALRERIRNVDAIRPIGADMDEPQVAVTTRTGTIGILGYIDQRVDRNGQLTPPAPEAGFRVEASAVWANRYFLSQDPFVKLSVAGSRFIPVGKSLVLRGDLRYDHGIPLGGQVMLPEVERFFGGGDNTVRGYAEDRLRTEIIQVGLPPFDSVSQIRVIPAGGNIRVLGSLDAQVRIWRILAGALFTDAGLITNQWSTVSVTKKWGFVPDSPDLRPSVGMGLRILTPFGIGAIEYAVPLRPQLGDDPSGRIHFYFAARAQF